MALESLPARPLKEAELRVIGRSVGDAAPMVVRPDPDGSDIHAVTLVQEDFVTALVLEADGWRVLDRRERPHPPPAFEELFREWARDRPDLVSLC
jgi:hypothetical protein